VSLQAVLGLFAGTAFYGQGLAMGELGMGEPGLQGLNAGLCLMQRAPGSAMGSALRLQGGIQFADACLEWCRWIVVAAAVQHDDRNAAILDKTVAWAGLVGTLLRRLP